MTQQGEVHSGTGERQQPSQVRLDYVSELFFSMLDDINNLLRLYFTLSTGAIVLFITVLAQLKASRLVLAPLVVSTFLFGAEALLCLRLLSHIITVRQTFAQAAVKNMPSEELKKQLDVWTPKVNKTGKRTERIFMAGIIFAALFVLALFLAR